MISYNNAENHHNYYSKVLLEKDIDSCSRSCSTDKQIEELRELIEVCCQNILHIQELQK